ncbi:MAG TPA: YggT family protein [Bellilinea sp.]|nr:YggT family protein [Bellilinea sp.]
MTDYKEVRTTAHEQGSEGRVTTFKVTQLIWLLVGLLEGVLALRFIFKLIGVNAANAFASLLYSVTDLFVAPFASLTGAPAAAGMVLEISTLIAMVVYALIGWVLARIAYVLFYRPTGPVSTRQTVVAEHTPLQGVSQTRTTTTKAPSVDSQTTTTENTNTL